MQLKRRSILLIKEDKWTAKVLFKLKLHESKGQEKIQAGLAEYNASVEKTVARFPERGRL